MDPNEVAFIQNEAMRALENAYAPYSQFKVGAAVLTEDGRVHIGCNVENAAYGPTNCAERTALFRAIADGYRPESFRAIAVVAHSDTPVTPCGVCRQVMHELCGPSMPVIMGDGKGNWHTLTVEQLLPYAFQLDRKER